MAHLYRVAASQSVCVVEEDVTTVAGVDPIMLVVSAGALVVMLSPRWLLGLGALLADAADHLKGNGR